MRFVGLQAETTIGPEVLALIGQHAVSEFLVSARFHVPLLPMATPMGTYFQVSLFSECASMTHIADDFVSAIFEYSQRFQQSHKTALVKIVLLLLWTTRLQLHVRVTV